MMPARVMVVEDERIVALHLQQQLMKLGYGVPGVAVSGEQALLEIEASRPDLILMDIHIEGGIDGIETVARIPADYHIPVIYLTAYSEEATLERARATRPYGYLIKPFSERELHATIQMTLERCSSERALRKSEAALRQAQKMEAIGMLAGGVAHDFNNLLGVIIGNLEFIADRAQIDDDMREMVQDTLDAALRSASLTQQLLAYSRRQPLIPKVVSIARLVSNLTELMRRTIGETVQIRTRIPGNLWRVRVDPNQFDTALLNLAVNARDAMPGGGVLTIETDNVVLDQSYADQHADMTAGEYVLIAVTDTGTGMPKEVTEKALEPFFTTKPVGKGTGLGLSMVYGFVRQSNGHLEINSEAGRGTTVKLYFPGVDIGSKDQVRPAAPDTVPLACGGEVILIVEDDAAMRKFVVSLVASLGYVAIEAEDGEAARQLLDQTGHVDLLLADVMLPNGMSGLDVARAAQARRPGLHVLFMSGYTRNAVVHNGALDEGVHLLTKPFRRADLARKLRQVLDNPLRLAGLDRDVVRRDAPGVPGEDEA